MLLTVLCILVSLLIGLFIGVYIERIIVKLNDIWNRDPEPPAQVITPKAPGYADVMDQSAFISPKTPAQIEREERERSL